MTPPNLFNYATSELTQDAFLAYLLAWADPATAELDSAMHQAGTEFLRLLLARHDLKLSSVNKLEVRVQVRNIDVLVYLEMKGANGIALVIEDKVHAGSYNDLPKYLAAAREEYPAPTEVRGIYLRTGNQADYSAIEAKGFRVVDRKMMLGFLQDEGTGNPLNAIFQNYRTYLTSYQAKIDAYKTLAVGQWNGDAWVGFFSQVLLPDSGLLFDDYGYVANRSGGFQGCWCSPGKRQTFGKYTIYLQVDGSNTTDEESFIKVKMETFATKDIKADSPKRIELIRTLADKIQSDPEAKRLGLERPKLRAGQWMTAASVTPADNTEHLLQQLRDLEVLVFSLGE